MKTQPVTRYIAVVCAGILVSCASPPTPPSTKMKVSASTRPDSSLSGRLYQEVNAYRRSQGADELQRHAGLDRLAQDHCEYLRQHRGTFKLNGKNVSHIGFEGRALIARERFRMENISENVAAANHPGSSPTPVIVRLWKGSKDHHKNMVDGWTHTGVGVLVDSDGMTFATQLFSTVSMSQMSTRERFNRF
jgi:uncharacterized protein YkwD